MEPLPVLSINYSNETDGPWPRILKILAVGAIVFGALKLASSAIGLQSLWNSSGFRSLNGIYWIRWGSEFCVNILIAAGGLVALKGPNHYRFLLLVAWVWCILIALALSFQAMLGLSSGAIAYLAGSLFYGATQAVFPAIIILLLSEYRKSQRISPQPRVPPAFRRWPGQS